MVTATFRSTLFDKVALMFWGSIGGMTFFFCLLAFSQWSILRTSRERQKVDLADISALFENAVLDGSVQGLKDREFVIRQGRGRTFIVSFTNFAGEMSEILVHPSLEKRDIWKFHQVTPKASENEFYRSMANTK